MTTVVIPYAPRPQQRAIHDGIAGKRFAVLVCHRRMGKTVLGVNHLIRGAVTCRKERPRYGYIAPTYSQGKSVSFDYFQHYSGPVPGRSVNQSELRIDYPNGGQVRIYGADNPDSLRGLYFDGVVLDEFGLHPSKTFSEVIGPTLVDRGGSALFLGTPNGKNQFYDIAQEAKARMAAGDPDWFFAEYKASETGLLDPGYLRQAASVMTEDEYRQEFECSFEASVKGAIYAAELQEARDQGRIGHVPLEPALPVDTDWDLGVGDATAIWFSQSLRSGEVRLVGYYSAEGEGLPHYAGVLKRMAEEQRFVYGKHWAPHDIAVRELGTGKSRLDVARELGIRFEVCPRITGTSRGELEEGIHQARLFFRRCWFDEERCKGGLEALMHYRRDYNRQLNEFKATPVHDRYSHGADAFRYLATRHQVPREPAQVQLAPQMQNWAWA